jgi:endonuclease III
LHASFDKPSTVPVDSHVWFAFKKYNWTNAVYPDECSWQTSRWMDPSYFMKTNDVIGSIRQCLANNFRRRVLLAALIKEKNPRLTELVTLLDIK